MANILDMINPELETSEDELALLKLAAREKLNQNPLQITVEQPSGTDAYLDKKGGV